MSIFDLTIDFIGFGWRAARQPNPMKSIDKTKMDKVAAIPGLAILPGFLIILFGSDACKLLILQEPVLAEFPNRELLTKWSLKTSMKPSWFMQIFAPYHSVSLWMHPQIISEVLDQFPIFDRARKVASLKGVTQVIVQRRDHFLGQGAPITRLRTSRKNRIARIRRP